MKIKITRLDLLDGRAFKVGQTDIALDVVKSIEWKADDEMYWVAYGLGDDAKHSWIEVPFHSVQLVWVERCGDE